MITLQQDHLNHLIDEFELCETTGEVYELAAKVKQDMLNHPEWWLDEMKRELRRVCATTLARVRT